MRKAVIDLGTNTCNLLIAEVIENNFHTIHTSKYAVQIGKGGINKRMITPEATQRAVDVLKKHLDKIKTIGGVTEVITIATSAVRDADNQSDFEATILKETGLELTVISGDKEAEFIFNGVKFALQNIEDNSIIMDIGGGSNEFIIVENNEIKWKKSFATGIARIVDRIKISDPILPHEIEEIENWLITNMSDLWEHMDDNDIPCLIGCSGTFDTIADIIENVEANTVKRRKFATDSACFINVCENIISTTYAERNAMQTMEKIRIEMAVPAVILIRLIAKRFKVKTIIQTDYSLKEGAALLNAHQILN